VALSERLTPMLSVDGRALMLETPKMAAVPRRMLSTPVASLAAERERITAALDFLFQGF
jgi:toxin CcdB